VKRKQTTYQNSLTWVVSPDQPRSQTVVVMTLGPTKSRGGQFSGGMDNHLIRSVCHEAVARTSSGSVLFPHVHYGCRYGHDDFPGGITVGVERVLTCVVDLVRTIAEKGFKRILLGGADTDLLTLVSQQAAQRADTLCGVLLWQDLLEDTIQDLGDSTGVADRVACSEDSAYLHVNPTNLQGGTATAEFQVLGSFLSSATNNRCTSHEHNRHLDAIDTWGSPQRHHEDIGKELYETCVSRLVKLIRGFQRLKSRCSDSEESRD